MDALPPILLYTGKHGRPYATPSSEKMSGRQGMIIAP